MFGSFDISASALSAQRVRLNTIASNIANIHSVRDPSGNINPYRRLHTVFASQRTPDGGAGVRVAAIEEDQSPLHPAYEPWNQDCDSKGYVYYPNVNLSTEYIDALETTRAYEANVTAIETTKSMLAATLRVLA